jgi:hypothetical protein
MAKNSQDELIEKIASFRYDPLGFAKFAYDWNVGELEGYKGLCHWQEEAFDSIGKQLRENKKIANGQRPVIKLSRASGNGIGKSAFIAILTQWALSVCPDARVNITAGTGSQLATKTWPVIATWFRRCITREWFDLQATSITSVQRRHEQTWRADAVTWSKENPESFAGLHNQKRLLLLIVDEASQIPDIIFETAEGALTDSDTDIIFVLTGNPTRNTGFFHSTFNSRRKYWDSKQIDSRTVEITNKGELREQQEYYGEDSDWFRVHVRGEFPLSSTLSFIPAAIVEQARKVVLRESDFNFAPVIIGVDGSYRGDEAVIMMRQGLYSHMLWAGRNIEDDVIIANKIAIFEDELKADAVFVDMGGGTGIVSAGKAMGRKWRLVSFAEAAGKQGILNKRAEMYYDVKEWLKQGAEIPDDPILCEQLVNVETKGRLDGKLQLEAKEEIKKRGFESPGRSDALCFLGNTLINTKKGKKRIDEIVIGDQVTTPMGYVRVVKTHESYTNKITTVSFSNGGKLSGKGDHKIFTWDAGWVRLDKLSLTNEIESDTMLPLWKTLNLLFIPKKRFIFREAVDIIRLETKNQRSDYFIAGFIPMFSAQYQRACVFITKTKLKLITGLKTSVSLNCLNIAKNTHMNCKKIPSLGKKRLLDLKRQGLQRWLGMAVKRVLNGILETAKRYGNYEYAKTQDVLFAKKNIKPFLKRAPNFVLKVVCKKRLILNIKQKLENVFCAAKSLYAISINRKSVVPTCVLTDYLESELNQKVYNLTLEKENVYYANGILVSNCLTHAYPVKTNDERIRSRDKRTPVKKYDPLSY